MTCDDCVVLVGELVDGTAHSEVAQSVRRHLGTCAPCRALAEDLSRLRAAAADLGPIEPPPHVWDSIEARLRSNGAPANALWEGLRPVLAAAAGFALVVSSLTWVGSRLPGAATQERRAEAGLAEGFQLAEAAYQATIEDLETIATEGQAPFIAETALVALQTGLADLDEVIGETRDQLSREPDDQFSQESLLAALDSKVTLLQDALALLDQTGTEQGANP